MKPAVQFRKVSPARSPTFCVTGFWLCISECYRRFNQTHFRSASKLSGACIAGEIVCLCAWECWQRSRHSPLLAARGKAQGVSFPFSTLLPNYSSLVRALTISPAPRAKLSEKGLYLNDNKVSNTYLTLCVGNKVVIARKKGQWTTVVREPISDN